MAICACALYQKERPILPIIKMPSGFQTVLIEQEIIDAHQQHALFIIVRRRRILRDDHTLEKIARQHQRALLLLHLCGIGQRVGGLDIVPLRSLVADEINLKLSANAAALFIPVVLHDDADIHIEAANLQFIEDDILHAVRLFQLSEIQPGISQSHVRKVIFQRSVHIFLSLHIIAHGAVDQERITEIINISLDRAVADALFLDRFESRRQLFRIRQRADGRRENVQKLFQFRLVANVVPADNIGNIRFFKERFQKAIFCSAVVKLSTSGKPP
mgnify:CR=1 FL=1